jgi:DNA-binding transcriptional MocR family regulator
VAPNWTRYLDTAASRPSAALLSQVRAARLRPGMLDLTRADPGPDFWPQDALAQLWRTVEVGTLLEYGPPEGWMPLREALAQEMARRTGHVVSPASVLITAGASQALYLAARGLLKPGDGVAMESPSYYYALPLFQSCGIRLLPIQMDRQGLMPDALEATLRQHRPAMVWVNPTHHNPTGTVLSAERRAAVLELAARWQVPVLEDDAFNGLDLPGAGPPAPLYAQGGSPHVIYVGTVSKSVAPGLRVGWMVAPDPVIRQLADVKGQMDLGTPLAMQALVAAWLTHPERARHESAIGRRLLDRLEPFQQALKPLHALGATWERPTGGFYQWLRWPEGKTDRQWLASAVHRAGLTL